MKAKKGRRGDAGPELPLAGCEFERKDRELAVKHLGRLCIGAQGLALGAAEPGSIPAPLSVFLEVYRAQFVWPWGFLTMYVPGR